MSLVSRARARLLWHPDKWERHVLVARCVGEASSVLDVGGRRGELARMLPRAKVVTANVEAPADLLLTGPRLPFGDREFEAVTSCDVVEHLSSDRRTPHVEELVRVARERVVVCCPLGTPEHAAAERELARRLREEIGIRLQFLDEHLEHGLPSESELRDVLAAAAPDAHVTFGFHGDVGAANRILEDGVRARWGRDPTALMRYLRAAYLARRRPRLEPRARATSNRLFAVVELGGHGYRAHGTR